MSVRSTGPVLPALYGVINGILLIPVSISFTSIIFSDAFFQPYLPLLVKLVLFSSMVHQISFTMYSSLPFAVGQVQDAGLIFLSAMASTTVQILRERSEEGDVALTASNVISTVLVELSLSTLMLGVILVVMGRLKLASLVQYLPVPVIGGYLAYIGFFCGRAGIIMMAGPLPFMWVPGVVMGCGMYASLRSFRSPAVLPVCMITMLVTFFGVLYMMGYSIKDARHQGWIAPLQPDISFVDTFNLLKVSQVEWSVLPQQFLRWAGMVLVVAFSSSLDVAAIEMELGLPLDYNRELETVGISNVLSGSLCGYTGSYIFSQTIFTMRQGVFSRTCGWFIVLFELAVVLSPVSVTSFIPKCFFGSLLILISVDLMFEWLVLARTKMMLAEYFVCLLTFFSIQVVGVEGGLGLGILFASVGFVISYATHATVTPRFMSSTVVRTFEERQILISNRGKIVTLSLRGYIFFGSAVKILEDVKSSVVINTNHLNLDDMGLDSEAEARRPAGGVVDLDGNRASDTAAVAKESHNGAAPLLVYNASPIKNKPHNVVAARSKEPVSSPSERAIPSPLGQRRSHSSADFTSGGNKYGSISPSPGSSPSLTEPDEELGRQQWSTGGAGTGAKSLSVYDMSGDDLKQVHKKLHHDGGSEVSTKSRGFFASAWSNQTAYREAKKGSIGSLVEMQQQQSTQPYRSLSRTEPSVSAAEVSTSTSSASSAAPADSIWGFFSKSRTNTLSDSVGEETQGYQRVSSSPTSTTEGERESESEKGGDGSFLFRSGTAGGEGGAEVVRRTEFLVLDFSETTGIDATATKSCFLMLSQLMKASKVTVVFANMPRSIEQLFASNGVTRDGDVVIRHLDDALEWCEEQVLANSLREGLVGGHRDRGLLRDPSYYASAWRRRHGDTSSSGSSLSFSKSLSSSASGSQSEGLGSAPGSPFRSDQSEAERTFAKHTRALRKIFEDHLELTAKDDRRVGRLLTPSLLGLYFVRSTVPANATLFDLSERADHIYFLEDGEVELVSVTTATNLTMTKGQSVDNNGEGEGREGVERVSKAGPGSIFGEATFFLGACQCLKAITLSDCSVWSLSREDLARMEINHPALCMLCQLVLLKSMSINSASSLYKLYPETAFSTSLFDDG